MASPFPGMDPYLEAPSLWETVHHWILSALAEELGEAVPDRYWVAIEKRVYAAEPEDLVLVGRPDASVVGLPRGRGPTRGGTAVLAPVVEVSLPVPDQVREGYLEIRDP